MMPSNPNTGGATVGLVIIGGFDPFDLLDIFERPPKRPSATVQSLEQALFENATATSNMMYEAASKGFKLLRITVIGLKIAKLAFADDDSATVSEVLLSLDELLTPPGVDVTAAFRERVRQLQQQASDAGIRVMDPVWLGDP